MRVRRRMRAVMVVSTVREVSVVRMVRVLKEGGKGDLKAVGELRAI